MTCGSNVRRLFEILTLIYTAVVSVSGHPVSLPNNVLQFKNQPDQYPFRPGYFTEPQHYEPTKFNSVPQQAISQHHGFAHQSRAPIYADELPSHLQPVESPTNTNHQPTYYPFFFNHQKDTSTENPIITNKILGLANLLTRNHRPDTVKNPGHIASASEIHQEVCAPPQSSTPSVAPDNVPHPLKPQPLSPTTSQNPPCPLDPQPLSPPTPQKPPCPLQSQPLASSTSKNIPCPLQPQCPSSSSSSPPPPQNLPCPSQPKASPPSSSQNLPCPQQSQSLLSTPHQTPPLSHSQPEIPKFKPPIPAPKFTPAVKNPFHSEPKSSEDLTKSSFVSVSPLHPCSKHPELAPEPPCVSGPPSSRKTTVEYEIDHQIPTEKTFHLVPAEKPIVYNPFSENKRERIIPLPNPKGILHHRLHADDDHIGYPEGYASRSDTQTTKLAHMPYVVYPGQFQTIGGIHGQHFVYPYIPPPITKPIPLVVPPGSDVEDEEEGVHSNEEVYHKQSPSRRYNDDESWSKDDILRNIADKLGAILDENNFRSRRIPSRRYPDTEREYYDDERYEDDRYSPGKYAWSNRDYFEEDYDNDRWKERKYSRGPSY